MHYVLVCFCVYQSCLFRYISSSASRNNSVRALPGCSADSAAPMAKWLGSSEFAVLYSSVGGSFENGVKSEISPKRKKVLAARGSIWTPCCQNSLFYKAFQLEKNKSPKPIVLTVSDFCGGGEGNRTPVLRSIRKAFSERSWFLHSRSYGRINKPTRKVAS